MAWIVVVGGWTSEDFPVEPGSMPICHTSLCLALSVSTGVHSLGPESSARPGPCQEGELLDSPSGAWDAS